eukprot:scaffold262360_cov16-Tisochrysis_lutea.AAC.1
MLADSKGLALPDDKLNVHMVTPNAIGCLGPRNQQGRLRQEVHVIHAEAATLLAQLRHLWDGHLHACESCKAVISARAAAAAAAAAAATHLKELAALEAEGRAARAPSSSPRPAGGLPAKCSSKGMTAEIAATGSTV